MKLSTAVPDSPGMATARVAMAAMSRFQSLGWPGRVALTCGLAGLGYRVILVLLSVPGTASDEGMVGLAGLNIARLHDALLEVIDIVIHLPGITMFEGARLEVEQNVAAEQPVEKHQIKIIVIKDCEDCVFEADYQENNIPKWQSQMTLLLQTGIFDTWPE